MAISSPPAWLAETSASPAYSMSACSCAFPSSSPHLTVIASKPRWTTTLIDSLAATTVQTWDHTLCWGKTFLQINDKTQLI
ncbi:unnamed protein product [Pieris macdunnoughi]|uniref:Uncharacterized protein n=1 Tax=Pieris macdunnoughi TaxID=345717 RepID=A0A821SR18_9NEOP|nr:unnamed protein product [Pieris macdunnoughi]